jgi:tetratricopeptide (TPR) repeat protein
VSELNISIDPIVRRVCLAAVVLVYFALAFFTLKWGLGNSIAARADIPEAAVLAAQWAPDDPETNFVAAQLLEETFDAEDAAASLGYYERAASLSPNNYLRWLDAGRSRERSGDPQGAEAAYRRALELAPNYSLPQWSLGNALLRQGRADEAFAEIRRAVAGDPKYTPVAASTAWQYFDGDINYVQAAVGDSIELRAALSLLLAGQERFEESVDLWNALPIERRGGDLAENGRSLSDLLLRSGRHRAALSIMNESAEANDVVPRIGQITNGGFERPLLTADKAGPFDWRIEPGTRPAVGPSEDYKLKGQFSMIVLFGREPHADLRSISQLIAVEPGGHYSLSFSYRAALEGNGRFRWLVLDPSGNETLASSELFELQTDWQNRRIEFRVPSSVDGVVLRLVRDACPEGRCISAGSLWFDEFTLSEVRNGE